LHNNRNLSNDRRYQFMNTNSAQRANFSVHLANRRSVVPMTLILVVLVTIISPMFIGFSRHKNSSQTNLELIDKYNDGIKNLTSDALEGIITLEKEYVIPENILVCPKPDASCYGKSTSASDVEAALERAASLGWANTDEVVWDPDIERWNNTPYEYYQDDTIFVVMWKEYINHAIYNFAEVFIAHPSQFKRMLTDNEFGSNTRTTPSVMAKSVNAVCAMSADFYGYRGKGIVVYNRKLCRNNPGSLETMYLNGNGDFIFKKGNELGNDEQLQKFIDDNDILFSLSFGPVLVRDGKAVKSVMGYPIGQPDGHYARAAIGQVGKLHYLLCTVDGGVKMIKDPDLKEPGVMLINVAKVYEAKGCINAYTLDGGQTATIVMDDHLFNRVGYGNERQMSDIIYFATAISKKGDSE